MPNSLLRSLSINDVAYPSTKATIRETRTVIEINPDFSSEIVRARSSSSLLKIALLTANISATVRETVIK